MKANEPPVDELIVFDSKLWAVNVKETLRIRGRAEEALPHDLKREAKLMWACQHSALTGGEMRCYKGGTSENCILKYVLNCEDWRPRP